MISQLRRAEMLKRAQGCLLGQLAEDALGSLVEFQTPEQIRREYPDGIRELADGGTWNTIAGQPTDDSEMALLLARLIPAQWTECVLNCRPAAGQPHVRRPRPECFWPVDALELARHLLTERRKEDR